MIRIPYLKVFCTIAVSQLAYFKLWMILILDKGENNAFRRVEEDPSGPWHKLRVLPNCGQNPIKWQDIHMCMSKRPADEDL